MDLIKKQPAGSSEALPIFCPSCAAKVEGHAGETVKCPLCGTEFTANSSESAERSISTSERAAGKRPSTEEILFQRLKSEPSQSRPVSPMMLVTVLVAIALATFAIYRISAKPDQFAAPRGVDSTQLFQQRLRVQSTTDSLENVLKADPTNLNAQLALANTYYDGQYWSKSIAAFRTYLHSNPQDVSARVDFAFAMAQQPDGIPPALDQIDTALKFKPDYLPGLYNGGVLAVQLNKGVTHAEALARARNYFERARAVADTMAPQMAKQIDTLLAEINKTGNIPAKN